MRLINTRTLEISTFTDDELPEYAILSHTWGSGEITFQEMMARTTQIEDRSGFEKIRRCCELAVNDGWDYMWADTCCIDKTSSAELSEAINSMFRWYQQAQVCYAYLSDVPTASAFGGKDPLFDRSRWFSRGWTLQELLAPAEVIFFSAEWERIGTKDALAEQISTVTGVSQEILKSQHDLHTVSIARRMSWAAGRKTTRTEDIAYCMMGIFDINMPMLYGEGEKAFVRLQEEIVKSTEDHSIFAWEDSEVAEDTLCGLLAPHPRCFATTGNFEPVLDSSSDDDVVALTNRGLSLHVRQHSLDGDRLTAMFDCAEHEQIASFAFIYLLPVSEKGSKFARIRAGTLGRAPRRGSFNRMVVRQKPRLAEPQKPLQGQQWFCINSIVFPSRDVQGGEKLAYFTVAGKSSIRPLQANKHLTTKIEGRHKTRIYDSLVDFLFQLPQTPKQSAVTLHISAQDQSGWGIWYHAKIDIGALAGTAGGATPFAIAAHFCGEGDEDLKEVDSNRKSEQERFANAQPLPTSMQFELEEPMVVDAALSWDNVNGQSIPCISLVIRDK